MSPAAMGLLLLVFLYRFTFSTVQVDGRRFVTDWHLPGFGDTALGMTIFFSKTCLPCKGGRIVEDVTELVKALKEKTKVI